MVPIRPTWPQSQSGRKAGAENRRFSAFYPQKQKSRQRLRRRDLKNELLYSP
jgi:hypothetical protein